MSFGIGVPYIQFPIGGGFTIVTTGCSYTLVGKNMENIFISKDKEVFIKGVQKYIDDVNSIDMERIKEHL